nr:PREDICTED: extracellular calcium-sensing receptor-like [Latimeria chalumnae]|eukprot:XP_006011730.2 PREDICTED: extracellular calcium-sensing receptor-like [Latimeria chalumnae]
MEGVPAFNSTPETAECVSFDFRAFRWAQAMIFAIDEINKSKVLLPNISLGYKIYDSCASPSQALRAALTLVNGQEENFYKQRCKGAPPVLVLIGESGSSQSIAISRIVQPFGVGMISYFSTCACLSNKREFPTFLRTVPSDLYQAKALAQLVKQCGWTWIATIKGDNEYGTYGVQAFSEEVKKYGVCIAFSEAVLRTYPRERILHIVETIKKSTVKVILAFASEGDFYPLVKEVVSQNITGIQWIASEAWITAARPSTKENFNVLGGTIGFVSRKMEIPALKYHLLGLRPSLDYNKSFLNDFWESMFGCKLQMPKNFPYKTAGTRNASKCTGEENLESLNHTFFDVTQLRVTYNVYKAVYSIAHGLHNLIFCENSEKFQDATICVNISDIQPWQLLQQMKNVKFINQFGESVYFDENGDPAAYYDIINWQLNSKDLVEHVTVGYFIASAEKGKELIIHEDSILWNGGQSKVPKSICTASCPPSMRKGVRQGEPICCFDCIMCAEGEITNQTDSIECIKCPVEYWSNQERNECIPKDIEFLSFDSIMGMILVVVAVLGASLTLVIAVIFMCNKHTAIIKANNSELSFLLLFSLLLCFLCSLTFIGKPTLLSCMVRQTFFCVTFVLCVSCILAKTVVVVAAFKATGPKSNIMRWFGPVQQRFIVFICTSMQILICIVWLIRYPPFPEENMNHHNEKIILECNLGSEVIFYSVLGYIGILSCMCFVLAFLARKLPDNFNETKFITFSMLIFCAVWLTFIPAYISSPGKYTVAVEIFAILFSSFGLLFCIFVPKCYVILFKPEKNTRKHIMGKVASKKL